MTTHILHGGYRWNIETQVWEILDTSAWIPARFRGWIMSERFRGINYADGLWTLQHAKN